VAWQVVDLLETNGISCGTNGSLRREAIKTFVVDLYEAMQIHVPAESICILSTFY
jgi:hypothetical protein